MNELEWKEVFFYPRVDLVMADLSPKGWLLKVEHPEWFKLGDLIRHMEKSQEMMKVLEVRPNGLRLKRGIGANSAGAIRKGDHVLIVGNASPA